MKKFKITKSRQTLWRHAISDLANVSDLQGSEKDSGDHQLDVEAKQIEFPRDIPVECDSVESADSVRSSDNDSDGYENSARAANELMHDERLDVDNEIGWRWLIDESESDSGSQSDGENELLTERNLTESLANWATTYGVQQSAVGSLLTILKPLFPSIPKDPRTLLKTSTQYSIKPIGGGKYCHIGLLKGISSLLGRYSHSFDCIELLQLQINVDGIPLFKSSNIALWPILCSVINIDSKNPFVVGLFCGKEKPKRAAEFLSDFVIEAVDLIENGLSLENRIFPVVIHCFVCDAPARAFIKGTKCHSGYASCEKCTVHGEYYAGKVIFPSTDAPLRTDESFKCMDDEDHHVMSCPLDPLDVGFVSKFGLDYLHLVCLGVMRRFLLYWKGPVGPIHVRLGRKGIVSLSARLLALVPYVPYEFARKPRVIDEILRWKATEFRQFVMYSGPFVLNGILAQDLYEHFMLLFVAMRILASPQLVQQVEHTSYADKLLTKFVKDTEILYGKEALVYNVHNLVHLAADVKQLGCLDKFSAFPFENKLGQLKKLVRKPQQPIKQIIKRLDEEQSFRTVVDYSHKELLKGEHNRGPLLAGCTGYTQYKRLETKQWTVSNTVGNNCVIIKGGIPVLVKNIVKTKDNVITLICVKFQVLSDAFSYPLASSKLSIFKVERECQSLFPVPLTDVIVKSVCWPVSPDYEKYVVLPLLH